MESVAVLLAAGYALTLWIYYPGVMTYDAKFVYEDIAKGTMGDWQSPVMIWLWGLIDPIAPGSASMFLLIATTYWLGFGSPVICSCIPRQPMRAAAASAGSDAAGIGLCRDHMARCAVVQLLVDRRRLSPSRCRTAVTYQVRRRKCWRLRWSPSESCCAPTPCWRRRYSPPMSSGPTGFRCAGPHSVCPRSDRSLSHRAARLLRRARTRSDRIRCRRS